MASVGPNDARGVLHALRDHTACIEMNTQLRQLCESLLGVIEQVIADLQMNPEIKNSLSKHGLRPRVFNIHQHNVCMPRDQEFVPTGPQSGGMPPYLPEESTTSRLPLQNLLPTLDFNSHSFIESSTGALNPGNLSRVVPPNDSMNNRVGPGPGRNDGSSSLEHLIRTGNLSEDQIQHILSIYQPK
ncbi:uncharacterized protein N7484_006756 [Penicillium longicatenatum]|uniref:uncharacterized protein n=1 Tax=Penicillium longicatenatum TaxID=1561947 RepID=UPI00254678B5|nr:uncharacterized protein N7484_006756 [Penicillium longicatenatum]KAJ5644249.1 hypothetical protein N7484_006756 [Penicillium longicatenatum]